jgi:PKD repeat protein
MKKHLYSWLFLTVGYLTLSAQPNYCLAGSSTRLGGEVSAVRLIGETQTINFIQPCLGVPYVNDQRANAIADLRPGNGYTLEVTYSPCNGGSHSATSVYLDYNQNGIFEPSEELDSRATASNPQTQQFLFWVPLNATPGMTTFRILMMDTWGVLPINPCIVNNLGSAADFSVYITETANCTSPAVNLAKADRNSICAGDSVFLSATDVSYGPGISHQWEVSQDNIVYNLVPGGSQVFFKTGPIATNQWYRLRVSCGAQSVYSQPILIFANHVPLPGGTYSINALVPTGGTVFNSFGDFFARIQCAGILGPVSVTVATGSGPYIEKVHIGPVPGGSATNTITINGQGETIQWHEGASLLPGVIVLEHARHLSFENLKIKSLHPQVGCGIHLSSGSRHNQFFNCEIELPFANFSTQLMGIIAAGQNLLDGPQQNTFIGNRISGGFWGMVLSGDNSAAPAIDNVIQDNVFVDFQREGIYASNQKDLLLTGNHFKYENHPGQGSGWGMRLTGNLEGGQISGNQFYNFGNSSNLVFIGLLIASEASGSPNSPLLISNNVTFGMDNVSQFRGFELHNSNNVRVLNNSILFADTIRQFTNAIMVLIRGQHQDLEIANNIFHCDLLGTSPVTMLHINGFGSIDINHNVYSNANANSTSQFINQRITYAGFQDWKIENRFDWDQFSVAENPEIDGTQAPILLPTSGAIDNIGKHLPGLVPTDFRDSTRSAFPDPGAFEFQGPPCAIPVQFMSDSILSDAVHLSWQQPGSHAVEWQLSYGSAGMLPGQAGSQSQVTQGPVAVVSGLTPGSCYDWYLRAICSGVNPDTSLWVGPLKTCQPFAYDLQLVRILEPTTQVRCGRDSNQVRVLIENNGTAPVTGAALQLEISGIYSANLRVPLAGSLAPKMRDTVMIYQFQLSQTGPLNLKVKVDWPLDQNPNNDSLDMDDIEMMAAYPTVLKDWYCPGDPIVSIELAPVPDAFHHWYRTPNAPNPFHIGDRYGIHVPDLVPYYVSYSIGAEGSLFTTNFPQQVSNHGVTFDLKPKKDMYVTGFDYRNIFQQFPPQTWPIRVFVTDSTSENKVDMDWRLVHQGVIMHSSSNMATFELDTPVFLEAGKSYGFYLDYETRVTLDAQFYYNADLEFHSGKYARDQPFDPIGSAVYNGGIHYVLEGCESERILIDAKPRADSTLAAFEYRYNTPQEVTFDASGSFGNQFIWDFGNGQTDSGLVVSHQFERPGIWEVKLEVSDTFCGLRDTAIKSVFISQSASEVFDVSVVPNPSSGVFTISFESVVMEDLPFYIFDSKSKLILEGVIEKESGLYQKAIDLSGFPAGVYYFKMGGSIFLKPFKLIKI